MSLIHKWYTNLLFCLEAKVTLSGLKQLSLNFAWDLGLLKQPRARPVVVGGLKLSSEKSRPSGFHTITILFVTGLKPLIHGQINLIESIWHIFWIKQCNIKFDVYTITLIWSNIIKLVSKIGPIWLLGVIQRRSTFCCMDIFWVP